MSGSDVFILHSYRYYLANWKANGHDANLIHGLMQKYQAEAIKRGLLRYNKISGQIEEVK